MARILRRNFSALAGPRNERYPTRRGWLTRAGPEDAGVAGLRERRAPGGGRGGLLIGDLADLPARVGSEAGRDGPVGDHVSARVRVDSF